LYGPLCEVANQTTLTLGTIFQTIEQDLERITNAMSDSNQVWHFNYTTRILFQVSVFAYDSGTLIGYFWQEESADWTGTIGEAIAGTSRFPESGGHCRL
jgi:hypothetical protein